MVKMLQLLSVTTVIAAGDDSTALLQQTFAHEQSVGNRILTAVADGGEDTICVEAAVGDIAPVRGSFTAMMGQQAVEVAAGSVAEENGSFCVQRQDVLLLQRTSGLHTANDIEVALVAKKKKKSTTSTTTSPPNGDNFETFDFAGDTKKKVMVKQWQCPDKSPILTQMMEATISKKGNKATLDADQVRVCACRNFLKDGVQHIFGLLNDHAGKAKAAIEKEAANDGVDAGTVKDVEGEVESDIKTGQIVADLGMVCKQAKKLKDWTLIAKMINHPTEVVPHFKAANISGWEHCAKSWIIESACAEIPATQPPASPEKSCEDFFGRGAASLNQIISIVDPDVPALFCDLFNQTAPCTFIHRAQASGGSNCVSPTPPDKCHKYIKVAYSKCDGLEAIKAGTVDVTGRFDPQTGVFKGCEGNVTSTDYTYWAPNKPISDQPPPTFPDTYKAIKCYPEE